MPRTLPWLQKGGSSTSVTRPKKATTTIKKSLKRPRSDESESDGIREKTSMSSTGKSEAHQNSSSPPPDPPSEEFMDEGMEHDDKYRMVEDEFLSVAQKWTVHLHTAEYKRQEKMVKARNANTISSISRPVTARMPDQTRQRVESVARSKTQKNAIEGLLGKKELGIDSEESDEDGLPYVGTTLHGLMDSPRRKTASLSKITLPRTATRAAAGLHAQSKLIFSTRLAPPLVTGNKNELTLDDSTASSDDDDDLDVPIPAPKLKLILGGVYEPDYSKSGSVVSGSAVPQTSRPFQKSNWVQSQRSTSTIERALPRSVVTNFDVPRASDVSQRRARRQQLAHEEEERQEQEKQKKRGRDVIPTFL